MAKITQRPNTGSGRPSKRPPRWLWAFGVLLAIVIVAAVYAVQAGDGSRGPGTLEALGDDPGVTHVHGLGINPANGDVYAATHVGVFRISKDGEATRIANRYQDTMGFTVAGPDHFLASGHPDLREELPVLLGLLESKDAARTWTKKSLLGESDFHALRYAHKTIYGYDSTGAAFMVSRDGLRWDTRSQTSLRDFAVSPKDPDVILATVPEGLERSKDGGRTWTQIESPAQPVLVGWERSDEAWLVDLTGRVHLSEDGGKTWDARGTVGPRPQAFLATGDHLYVAVEDGIYVSRDDAKGWKLFFQDGEDH
jgi:hypothetical protein